MMKGPAEEASHLTWWIRLRAVPWRHVHISRQRARWAVIWIIVSVAILSGAATLSAIGSETGTSSLVAGAVWAVLPVPFYLLLVLWLDRNEPEPLWALVSVFFWGALVATFIALIINTYGHSLAAAWLGESGAKIYAKCVSAPVIEEVAKGGAPHGPKNPLGDGEIGLPHVRQKPGQSRGVGLLIVHQKVAGRTALGEFHDLRTQAVEPDASV